MSMRSTLRIVAAPLFGLSRVKASRREFHDLRVEPEGQYLKES
jgi:hypothetical protein